MHKIPAENSYAFVIPNSKNHGAQNFFRRLYNNFDSQNKFLLIEEENNFLRNFLHLSNLSKNQNLKLITTVNSNKLGLIFKIFHPKIDLIARLGNTVSQEIKKSSLKFFIHKFFYFFLMLFSTKVIFQSEVMKRDFIEFFNFRNIKNKFHVIHNGVDVAQNNLTSEKKFLKLIDSSKINFLLVGSFKYQKGYDIFFNSLGLLNQEIFDKSHFHVCGGGEQFEHFQKLVSNSEYKTSITLHGEVEPAQFYKKCDVYILPSRFEGFSNSLIEALSFGLPTILADCPSANKEVVEENFNGVFFLNEDCIDLSKKIGYMIQNHAQFNKALIKEDIKNRFSINVIASIYKNLFI